MNLGFEQENISIKRALDIAKAALDKLATGRLDAELLLGHVLNTDRSFLYAHSEQLLSSQDWQRYKVFIQRRLQNEPVAYLIGYKEFWSLKLEVTQETLIPRPETELLVQIALEKINKPRAIIADLGVGSGAVAIALARERPNWTVYGTDFSPSALNVARRNSERHYLTNLILLETDWCLGLPLQNFDAIVSNPPYLSENDPHLTELQYEPKSALVAGEDGLNAIRTIIKNAKNYLTQGGWLLLEHGYNQEQAVINLLINEGYAAMNDFKDLLGFSRVATAQWLE